MSVLVKKGKMQGGSSYLNLTLSILEAALALFQRLNLAFFPNSDFSPYISSGGYISQLCLYPRGRSGLGWADDWFYGRL